MAHPRTLWLNGYQDVVDGDPFTYHGPVPDATSALLVRSNAERPAIAWRTAPVPATLAEAIDTLDVVWLFGLDVAPTRHRFVLHVDDRPLVTFTSPADASLEPWTVGGEQGARLSFRPTERDRHGDLLGFACLHLPASLARPGQPLTLRVTGEDAGQPVWFLAYQRAVSPEATVEPGATVAITDDGQRRRHHLHVMHLGDDGSLRVDAPGQPATNAALRFGLNRVAVDLPLDAPAAALHLGLPDGRSQQLALPTRPPRRWTVDLVQHTHTDIGYTRPQSEILPEHLRYLDHALECCDRTDHLPDDARFRWTCEALWPVVAFVRTRPAAQVARLRRRVDEGRIALTALPFNLSELADEALLHAMLAPLRELADLGLPVRLAMQDDVNGVAWCLADSLPPLGVRYLVMGQHDHRALTCFERPTAFWWESPAGSRLLAFRADHYMTGNMLGIGGGDLDAFGSALLRYLSALESSGYPRDRIAIQFSGYVTDNAPPSTLACDLVQRWNQAHAWPRLRLSTAVDFLDHLAHHHTDNLPVHRAAWPDWWSDGIGSAPLEAAAVRRAQAQATAGDALVAAAMTAGAELPADLDRDRAEVTSALLFCAEHTYGADDSVRDPLGQDTREQWGEKSSHAWEAVRRVRLRDEATWGALQPHLPTHREHPTIVVFNPLAHTRSGLATVNVDHQVWPPHRRVSLRDPRGHQVLAQPLHHRTDGTTWALWFRDVPPLGFAAAALEVHDDPAATPASTPGTELSSPYYRAVVDPDRGTLRHLHDLTLGADLVDPTAPWPLGACIHEQLGNRHQLEQRRLDDVARHGLVDVRPDGGHDGPVWRSLAFVGSSPATGATVRWEYRLHVATPRLELRLSLRNPGTCDPEAWYVAWPLALLGGQLRYEAQGGLVQPGRDQLVGSSSDWHAAQSLVSVVGDRGQVVLSSPETLLWQFGGLNLGRFQATAPVERPHAYSWVMNNYWTTNFRASLEGELRWGYQLTSLADGSEGAAMRAGQDARMPLMARVLPAGGQGAGRPLPRGVFREDLPHALLVAVTPDVAGRALMLHLREPQGLGCRVPLAEVLGPELAEDLSRVDGVGRVLGALGGGLDLGAHEVGFVRVGVGRSRHE